MPDIESAVGCLKKSIDLDADNFFLREEYMRFLVSFEMEKEGFFYFILFYFILFYFI